MSIIVKILEQRILGYSKDLKHTHFMHVVLLDSGKRKVYYSTNITNETGDIFEGLFVDMKPFVEVEAE